MNQISIFEPQEINGHTVEPLCIPSENTSISQTVAGATNLLWFAFHIALAKRDIVASRKLANMLKVVVDDETSNDFNKELDDAVFMLDELNKNEYNDDEESINEEDDY